MRASLPCLSIGDLTSWYIEVREREVSRRRLVTVTEVMALLEMYVTAEGMNSIDLRASATPSIVRGVGSIDTVRALLDDFEVEFLLGILDLAPQLVASYRPILHDFRMWLSGRRIYRAVLSAV